MKELLKKVKIFSSLSEQELEIIEKHTKKQSFPKNTTIFMQGDEGDTLYLITEGSVKVSQISEGGKEITLALLYQNDSFGEMALFGGGVRSASVKSIKKTETISLTRQKLLDCIRQMPEISLKLLSVLSEKILQSNGQIEMLAFDTLKQRLARLILSSWERENIIKKEYIFPFTHKETAEILGANRESITRLFKEFKDEGWIMSEDRKTIVLNLEGIRNLLCR